MYLSKKLRERVWLKYDKHCAYCGIELELKKMQPDHIRPRISRGTDDYENLNPSCKDCNNYKSHSSLETLREFLNNMFNTKLEYLFKSKTKMQVAINFGIVTLKKWDGKFFYEKFLEEKRFCKGCHADVTKSMYCSCGDFDLLKSETLSTKELNDSDI